MHPNEFNGEGIHWIRLITTDIEQTRWKYVQYFYIVRTVVSKMEPKSLNVNHMDILKDDWLYVSCCFLRHEPPNRNKHFIAAVVFFFDFKFCSFKSFIYKFMILNTGIRNWYSSCSLHFRISFFVFGNLLNWIRKNTSYHGPLEWKPKWRENCSNWTIFYIIF